jgi:hypothetical protein
MPEDNDCKPPSTDDHLKTDLALKRYDTVFRYLAYENNVYWVRGQFFLVGNTALAAFVLNQIPTSPPPPTWNQLWVLCVSSLTGIILTWLWRAALETGEQWIRHWTEILVHHLEADAFGDIRVCRPWEFVTPPPTPQRSYSARKLAHRLANLFRVVWSLTLIYDVFLGWAKWVGWNPAFAN